MNDLFFCVFLHKQATKQNSLSYTITHTFGPTTKLKKITKFEKTSTQIIEKTKKKTSPFSFSGMATTYFIVPSVENRDARVSEFSVHSRMNA